VQHGEPNPMPKLMYLMMELGPSVALEFQCILFGEDDDDDDDCKFPPCWNDFADLLVIDIGIVDDGWGPPGCDDEWIALLVLTVLEMATNFWRRVSEMHDSWPLKLFWCLRCLPHEPDDVRQAIAMEMLVANFAAMPLLEGQFPRKFLAIFHADILLASLEGIISERMYTVLLKIAWLFFQDTSEIEGMNSILKIMIKKSPAMHLHLLASRLTIKKTLAATLAKVDRTETESVLQLVLRNHDKAKLASGPEFHNCSCSRDARNVVVGCCSVLNWC
jgi:hypothetical protein